MGNCRENHRLKNSELFHPTYYVGSFATPEICRKPQSGLWNRIFGGFHHTPGGSNL